MRKETTKNVMRSGLVVIGAIAFGYISLQLGFKPYLEKAQLLTNNPPDQSPESDPLPQPEDQPKQFVDNPAIIFDGDGDGGS